MLRMTEAGAERLGELAPQDLKALLAAAEVVRELPSRKNLIARFGGTTVHLKIARAPDAWRHPEAKGLARAAAAGVSVPAVLMEGHTAEGPFVGTLDLAPARPLDEVLSTPEVLTSAQRAQLARLLAREVAALHAAGLHHKDLYANHVFVDPASAPLSITLIDLERLGEHGGVRSRWVVKDLAALWMSVAAYATAIEAARFLVAYRRRVPGLAPRHVRRLAKRAQAKATRMARHTPRTPVGEDARPNSGTPESEAS